MFHVITTVTTKKICRLHKEENEKSIKSCHYKKLSEIQRKAAKDERTEELSDIQKTVIKLQQYILLQVSNYSDYKWIKFPNQNM
jgi:hypothetical protein